VHGSAHPLTGRQHMKQVAGACGPHLPSIAAI
jgi:hypothetical protein